MRFVTGVANSQAANSALGTTWRAIASTPAVDARDNTGTNPASTGVPIYLLDGSTVIANSNADLWDGNLLNPLNVNEEGLTRARSTAWTGSTIFGIGFIGTELGALSANIRRGRSFLSDASWIDHDTGAATSSSPLYALSGTLTCTACPLSSPPPSVPAPASLLLFGVGLMGLAAIRRRRQLR